MPWGQAEGVRASGTRKSGPAADTGSHGGINGIILQPHRTALNLSLPHPDSG